MENAPSSADQAKLDKTLATPKGTPNTFVQGRPGNDSGTGGGDRLTALNSALEAQANKLRDIEVALIGRIADVDDDRRRTATEVRRALDAQRDDIEEEIRRRGLVTTTFVLFAFLVSVGAATLGLFQINTGDAKIGAQLNGIQEAVARLSTIDTAPLDERLGELDQAVTRLSGDLETKVDERQSGVTDLANRLKGLEETLASQPEQPPAKPDAMQKETEERQTADTDLIAKIEEIQKAQERLGKDMLLLRDSLANTLASANLPLEQKSWTPEETGTQPAEAVTVAPPAAESAPVALSPPKSGPALVEDVITVGDHPQALQLISFKNLEDVRRFANRADIPSRVYYREESRRGKPWYALFYSLYQDQAAAAEAKAALPAELAALKPIVRQLDAGTQLQVLDRAP
ncbi:MAG: SPOR domain-containing protein [Chromatiaceae bacterium]|nr:SPOR domain-containing protein [Chromatiaceae bacterium]